MAARTAMTNLKRSKKHFRKAAPSVPLAPSKTVPVIDRQAIEAFEQRTSQSPVVQKATAALDRVAAEYDLDEQHRLSMRAALFDALGQVSLTPVPKSNLPSKPPEEWTKRIGRKENPIAFIERVYAKWLDRGLTRSHLLTIDQPLYRALGVWLYRHPQAALPGRLAEAPGSRGRPPHKRVSSLPSQQKSRRPKM